MSEKKLHPSIAKFKEFVKSNPKIIKEVRSGKVTWQELYEDWYLLGEEDVRWEPYRTGQNNNVSSDIKKSEWLPQVLSVLKNMDSNQVQYYINNINQVLSTVQGIFSQFQGGGGLNSPKNVENKPAGPFTFNKD